MVRFHHQYTLKDFAQISQIESIVRLGGGWQQLFHHAGEYVDGSLQDGLFTDCHAGCDVFGPRFENRTEDCVLE